MASTIGSTIAAFKRAIVDDYQKSKESFAASLAEGDHVSVAIKGGASVLGCVIGAAGVSQVVKGLNETVPNPENESETQRNWTRVFVGSMAAFTGAATLYLALQSTIGRARNTL